MPRNLQPAVKEFRKQAMVYGPRRDVVSPTLALRAAQHGSSEEEEDSDAAKNESSPTTE